jgi:hypothetical protein
LVWFSHSEEGELTGFDDRKLTIEVGESFTVSTGEEYFYVTFKDENGKSRMSKKQLFAGNKATVTKRDLY